MALTVAYLFHCIIIIFFIFIIIKIFKHINVFDPCWHKFKILPC